MLFFTDPLTLHLTTDKDYYLRMIYKFLPESETPADKIQVISVKWPDIHDIATVHR